MHKTYEEMAVELTIAWVKSAGDACAAGKFNGSWLQTGNVVDAYRAFLRAINDGLASEQE